MYFVLFSLTPWPILALYPSNHQELIEDGSLTALCGVIGSKDIETRRCVAFALNNIAANEKNHVICDRLGVIKPIIQLAHEDDLGT